MGLLEKIEDRTAIAGIVGLGYVGLPLAVAFAEAGFRVKGIDLNTARVGGVNRCESISRTSPPNIWLLSRTASRRAACGSRRESAL